jgi:hypothetical protein
MFLDGGAGAAWAGRAMDRMAGVAGWVRAVTTLEWLCVGHMVQSRGAAWLGRRLTAGAGALQGLGLLASINAFYYNFPLFILGYLIALGEAATERRTRSLTVVRLPFCPRARRQYWP